MMLDAKDYIPESMKERFSIDPENVNRYSQEEIGNIIGLSKYKVGKIQRANGYWHGKRRPQKRKIWFYLSK